MFDDYYSSILGLWLILTTIMVQLIVAIRVHRGQEGGYSPGKVKPELGQLSFVFRTHRSCDNSKTGLKENELGGSGRPALCSGENPACAFVVIVKPLHRWPKGRDVWS